MYSAEEARQWEQIGLAREVARLTHDEDAELAAESERLRRLAGTGRYGWALAPTVEIMARYLAKLIDHRVKLRERVVGDFPSLASQAEISGLRQWIEALVSQKMEKFELVARTYPSSVIPKSILGAKSSLARKAEASKTDAWLALKQLTLEAKGRQDRDTHSTVFDQDVAKKGLDPAARGARNAPASGNRKATRRRRPKAELLGLDRRAFSAALTEARAMTGKSQDEVANELRMHRDTFGRLERNVRPPGSSLEVLLKFIKQYHPEGDAVIRRIYPQKSDSFKTS